MSVLFLLLGASLLLGGAFLYAFIRSVRAGQFDDTETPALRILVDDEAGRPAPSTKDPRMKPRHPERTT